MSKNSLIRLEQHRAHDDPARTLTVARALVAGKLANLRAMLLRANRKRDEAAIAQATATLKGVLEQAERLDPQGANTPADPIRLPRDT